MKENMKSKIIFTIGHSTKSIKEFEQLLKKYNINQLIDIRKIPYSRHNPQFNKDILSHYLRNRKIGYRNMVGLSGLRHTTKRSINTGLTNKSFRGFADYMQTDQFQHNIKKLIEIAQKKTIVLMCAELVPFRCHRSLIADALTAQGIVVKDIYSLTSVKKHIMRPYARIHNKRIYYPTLDS